MKPYLSCVEVSKHSEMTTGTDLACIMLGRVALVVNTDVFKLLQRIPYSRTVQLLKSTDHQYDSNESSGGLTGAASPRTLPP